MKAVTGTNVYELCCLVVGGARLLVIHVHVEHAIVATIAQNIQRMLDVGWPSANELGLYLAWDNAGEWLRADDHVVSQLMGNSELSQEICDRFFASDNEMQPHARITDYIQHRPPTWIVPQKTRCIHVLVVLSATSFLPPAKRPRQDENSDSVAQALVLALSQAGRMFLPPAKPTQLFLRRRSMRHSANSSRPMVLSSPDAYAKLWWGPTARSKIYISPAWQEVRDAILRWLRLVDSDDDDETLVYRCSLIHGIRGVGKSVFLAYLLYSILVRIDLAGVPLEAVVLDVPGVICAVICRNGRVVSVERSKLVSLKGLDRMQFVYLFDAVDTVREPLDLEDLGCNAIVTTSSEPPGLHLEASWQFSMKRTFSLPVWSLMDLRRCAQHCYSPEITDATVIELFYKWGGVPFCVLTNPDGHRDTMRRLLEDMGEEDTAQEMGVPSRLVREMLEMMATHALPVSMNSIFRKLVYVAPKEPGRPPELMFCSQFVCDVVMARLPLTTKTLATLHNLMPASVLTRQIDRSLAFLRQEEDEKNVD